MRYQQMLAATALLLAASILQCSAQGRVGRPPRPPSTPSPPPPPPYPTAQLINLTSGSNLCIEAAATRNGAKLIQARCSSTSKTQKWIILNVGAGLRIMSNADSTFCWNAWPLYDNAPPGNGGDYNNDGYDGAVRLWKCSAFEDDGQLFKPIAQPNGWSLMPKFSSSKCATLVTSVSETLLQLIPCTGSANQAFLFNGLMPPAAASPPPLVKSSPPPATSTPPPSLSSPPPKSAKKPPPPSSKPSPPPRRPRLMRSVA